MNTTPNENENIVTNESEAAGIKEIISDCVENKANSFSEAPADETPENTEAEATENDESEEKEVEATEPECADNTINNQPAVNAPPKKKGLKLSAFAGLIALILVCAILWVSYTGLVSDGNYPEIYDTSKMSAVFIKGSDILVHKANGEVYTLLKNTEDNTNSGYTAASVFSQFALRSPDGTAIFFYENFNANEYSGDLYVTYNNGEKILIDTGVSTGLMTSADGKMLSYAKIATKDDGTNEISLHLYRKGKKPQLLTNNYSPTINPIMSYNAKHLAYCSINEETGKTELYLVKTGITGVSEPKKVADDVTKLYSINNNGYVFYAKASTDENSLTGSSLYHASYNKAEVLIADDAMLREDCVGFNSNRFAYYTRSEDGKVKFYTAKVGKEPRKIFENTDFYLNPDVENNNYIFITINENDTSLLDIHRVEGAKTTTIAKDTSASGLNNVLNSRNYKKITYTRDFDEMTFSGKLFMSSTCFGMTKETKIADNASIAIGTQTLKYVAYFTDMDLNSGIGTLYVFDGKKSTKVAENVPCYSVSFSSDEKKLFYLKDSSEDYTTATLCMIKTNAPEKTTVIDTEISMINTYEFMYAARTNGNLYYFKNYDSLTGVGDLYFAKHGKKPTKVESGVSSLVLE